ARALGGAGPPPAPVAAVHVRLGGGRLLLRRGGVLLLPAALVRAGGAGTVAGDGGCPARSRRAADNGLEPGGRPPGRSVWGPHPLYRGHALCQRGFARAVLARPPRFLRRDPLAPGRPAGRRRA